MGDEEHRAADALGGILTSTMMHAYEERLGPRTFLYVWERDGLQWLLRYQDRHPDGSVGNDWMRAFLDLNRDAINDPDGRMDFNLRAARLASPPTEEREES